MSSATKSTESPHDGDPAQSPAKPSQHDTEHISGIERPSHHTYQRDIGEEIIQRIGEGESLREICRDEHMPPKSTANRWIVDDVDGLAGRYAHARMTQAHEHFQELLEWERRLIDNDDDIDAAKARVAIDSRKWRLAKMHPQAFGDRHQVDISGQVQHAHAHVHAQGSQSDLMDLLSGQLEIEESEQPKQVESRTVNDSQSEGDSEAHSGD